ncbi:unnamed protein product, partial [Mesorhabditis belari]|uniref:Uncharacterized protein n=1 Tax=Mesorhabditis belari TaxID=2138241 RepID=A0AAF3EH51_9BILA
MGLLLSLQIPHLLTRSFKRSINYRISEWEWMASFGEFLCELPEMIEQIPKVKKIRIKSILDSYREKFATMDQELEEKFRAFEESLNKANGSVWF